MRKIIVTVREARHEFKDLAAALEFARYYQKRGYRVTIEREGEA